MSKNTIIVILILLVFFGCLLGLYFTSSKNEKLLDSLEHSKQKIVELQIFNQQVSDF